jgi:hypothetical protein
MRAQGSVQIAKPRRARAGARRRGHQEAAAEATAGRHQPPFTCAADPAKYRTLDVPLEAVTHIFITAFFRYKSESSSSPLPKSESSSSQSKKIHHFLPSS